MSQNIFMEGLGYEGKITLTLKSNDRVLKTRTYKNKGTAQLFKFLGYCLLGEYDDVKNLLPTQIMLLYNNTEADGVEGADPTAVEQRSTLRGLAQTPVIISDGSTEQVKVIYSFEVPKATISGGAFNQVALYGAGMREADIQDFSAYYYLVDDYGDIESQDPDKDNWSATTVLLIEWELSLSNVTAATNNNEEE
jgi:hypothetical protein